jgi:uncharacterized protein DUF3263
MLALGPAVDNDGIPMELTARDVAVLEFERSWFLNPGTKRAAIRDRLGLSSTRYYEVLNALLETPAALTYDPLTVKRARRSRDARRRARIEGRRADPRSR